MIADRSPASNGLSDEAGEPSGRPPLRRYLTISWVVTIVGFTLVRLVVARGTLERYGLNVWIFGVIDLATALPYAIGVAKVVTAMIDRQVSTAGRWAVVAGLSFLAPYGYVAWAGKDGEFPSSVYFVLLALIVLFAANAIRGVVRRVRLGGRQVVEERQVEPSDRALAHPIEFGAEGLGGAGPLLADAVVPSPTHEDEAGEDGS